MREVTEVTGYECEEFELRIIRTCTLYRFSVTVVSHDFNAWVSTYGEDEALAEAINDLLDYASQKLRTVRQCAARYRVYMKEEPGEAR